MHCKEMSIIKEKAGDVGKSFVGHAQEFSVYSTSNVSH